MVEGCFFDEKPVVKTVFSMRNVIIFGKKLPFVREEIILQVRIF